MKKIFFLVLFLLFACGLVFYYTHVFNKNLLSAPISQKSSNYLNSYHDSKITSSQKSTFDESVFDAHTSYHFPWDEGYHPSSEEPTVKRISVKQWHEDFGLNYDFISGSILKTREYTNEDGTGLEYYLQGYESYYTFNDFGVVIGFTKNNSLDKQFYKKDKQFFARYKDRDYDVVYQIGSSNYIQKFIKSPDIVFDAKYLEKEHGVSGCELINIDSEYNKKYIVYDLSPRDTDSEVWCSSGANQVNQFVYDPQHPDRYYEISHIDGCAPSCGVFTYFEIL